MIPSINGGHLLERMLPTLDIPMDRVVVLDQGSTDKTLEICNNHSVRVEQLSVPHTYAQCCNISLDLAASADCKFVFISNNDIIFATDVVKELCCEIRRDPNLAILAPSQVIKGSEGEVGVLSTRVYWDLSRVNFEHDTTTAIDNIFRLEADFCELTCAVVRVSAAQEIGGFDNDFRFYHEDADFGFRLRRAGYVCAYLPQSQIVHFANSTFNSGKQDSRLKFIRNSRKRFARKHLGYGLKYLDHGSSAPTSWNIINQYLHKYMTRMGLVDDDGAELLFAHPGIEPFDYLYTVWETGKLPKDWIKYKKNYSAVYVPSVWNLETFERDGFEKVAYVPLGVETDIYHPWGNINRQYDEMTFLWFSRDQYRKGLDVMLSVWRKFHKRYPRAKLLVVGHEILNRVPNSLKPARQTDKFYVFESVNEGIIYKQIRVGLSPQEVASMYRGIDALVLTSRSEGFGFSVAEALACGAQVVFPSYGASRDMQFPECLSFGGKVISADYSDKNYFDVGDWWEPIEDEVLAAMIQVAESGDREKALRAQNGLDLIRSKFTWRNSVFAIYNDLQKNQDQSRVNYRYPGGVFSESESHIVSHCLNIRGKGIIDRDLSELVKKNIDEIFLSFDRDFYTRNNADVLSGRMDPLDHYVLYGWLENRRPSKYFDNLTYLTVSMEVRDMLLALHDELDADSNKLALRAFREWREGRLFRLLDADCCSTPDFIDEVIKILLDGPADKNWKSAFNKLEGDSTERRRKFIELVRSSIHYSEAASKLPRHPSRRFENESRPIG